MKAKNQQKQDYFGQEKCFNHLNIKSVSISKFKLMTFNYSQIFVIFA